MKIEAELRTLEARRCQALMDRDIATLDAMLAEDLIHIHGNGVADDKATYLRGVESKYDFRDVSRGDLTIRVYGDVAVMTGPLRQTISLQGAEERHEIDARTTQVWRRTDQVWLQNTCHNQFLPRS